MSTTRPVGTRHWALLGVACSSAAVLTLEVVLTRVFAVTQFYHFAFLAVSLALLGFGASGSVLTALPRLGRGGPRRWSTLAAAQALSTIGAYLVVNSVPFDSFSIAFDRRQLLYLGIHYVALVVPFFFGGAVIGVLLTGWDQPAPIPSRRVYAASLAGAAGGAVLALAGLGWFGGRGGVVLAALMACAAAVTFGLADPARARWRLAGMGALAVMLAVVLVASPDQLDLRLSPYKALPAALRYPGAEVVSTRWDSAARVDHIRSDGLRSLPGLSFTYPGAPPPQDGVAFDGDDISPIPRVEPEAADFASYLLASLPFALRPDGAALVLEPRGGLDVLVALATTTGPVTAVEPNGLVMEAARSVAGNVYDDPRVEVVEAEPRTYVERVRERFDVIDLALTDPYRPVSSGAYSLAEDYTLTVEAVARYLDRLEPGGVFAALRWVQTPPSEETRLLALAAQAVRTQGGDPVASVVALRGYANVLVLVAPDGFTAADLDAIAAFAAERRFDFVAAPGVAATASNLYNVLPRDEYYPLAAALLAADEPDQVYAATEFAVAPPRDDRPFFGHFFKWGQAGDVLAGLGRSWQPFGGAGYFVLLALLALSVLGAVLLIVAPLLIARAGRGSQDAGSGAGHVWWTLSYFGLLGIGFLFVEIPLIQRYILLIGRPTTALAVVLFALLLASGAGSLVSDRVPWRIGAGVLTAVIVAYPFLVRLLIEALLPAPLLVRMVGGGVALAPLGLLMGIMFPAGLARLERAAPQLVPWAWGVNGTMSVISAAASALLALTFGFTVVVVLGAACYAGAALLARSDDATSVSPLPSRG